MKRIIVLITLCATLGYAKAQVCGCTDPRANNYNPQATVNDGSCTYASTTASPYYSNNLPTRINGTSGLIYFDGKLYTHNDHGDKKIFQIDTTDGHILDSIVLTGIAHQDVEDCDQDSLYIYLGDHGNNNSGIRQNLHILRISKASLLTGTPQIDTIWFSYPDQTDFSTSSSNGTDFDCEAFIATEDSLYLFTKQWVSEGSVIYALPKTPGTYSARRVSSWNVGGLITGATYNPRKKQVVLCGYSSILMPFVVLLYDYTGNDFFSGNKRKMSLGLSLHQVEGIALGDDYKYYLTNEYFSRSIITTNAKFHKLDLTDYLYVADTVPDTVTPPDTTTSLHPVEGLSDIVVYPNPAREKITVEGLPQGQVECTLTDTKGRVALRKSLFSDGRVVIPINRRTRGTYTLKVVTPKGKEFVKKVIVR